MTDASIRSTIPNKERDVCLKIRLTHKHRSLASQVFWIKTMKNPPTSAQPLTVSSVKPPCFTDSWWVFGGTDNMSCKSYSVEGDTYLQGNQGQETPDSQGQSYTRTLISYYQNMLCPVGPKHQAVLKLLSPSQWKVCTLCLPVETGWGKEMQAT